VVAYATGALGEQLIERAVITTVRRTQQHKLHWFSDGWHGYQNILVRAYRQRKLTGKRGRPAWEVPATVTLTQTVKHRDDRGRLLSVEIRAALGAEVELAGTVHVERLNGSLRDRLNALTRKTHAFAKRDASLRCPGRVAALRSQLPAASSGLATASWRWNASLSPAISGHGSGADRSSLVIPRIVDDSGSYHPLTGSLSSFSVGSFLREWRNELVNGANEQAMSHHSRTKQAEQESQACHKQQPGQAPKRWQDAAEQHQQTNQDRCRP
jgi:hypothetical protein